jgi:uncharacterized delta-60 repeat protein
MPTSLRSRSLARVLVLALLAGSCTVAAAPGDLDHRFSLDGVAFLAGIDPDDANFLGHDRVHALLPLPDGGALAAGSFDNGGLTDGDLALVKLTPDGELDPEFGAQGRALVQFSGDQDVARALYRQPDGRIVVAGALEVSANTDFGIARFHADGSPDRSFGQEIMRASVADVVAKGVAEPQDRSGYTRFNLGPNGAANDIAVAVAMQSDGKLVLVGEGVADNRPYSDGCCYRHFALTRVDARGDLDTGFGPAGSNGLVLTPASGTERSEYATGVALTPDGTLPGDRITVVGYVSNPKLALVRRYLANGTPDPSFDGDGTLIIEDTLENGQATGLASISAAAYQRDGKLVVAGTARDRGFTVMRFLADGRRDPSFGIDGRRTLKFSATSDYDEPAAVTLQANGKIVVAGYFTVGEDADFGVVRLLHNGAPDAAFGNGGRVTHPMALGEVDDAAAVGVMADGSLLVGGYAQRPTPSGGVHEDMAFLRLLGDPDLFSDGFED